MELTGQITNRTRATTVAATVLAATMLAAPGANDAAGPDHGPAATYVLQAAPGALQAAEASAVRAGGEVLRSMRTLSSATVRMSASSAQLAARSPGVLSVTPDAPLHLASIGTSGVAAAYDPVNDPNSLYNVEQVTGARQVWKSATGAGVDVALIDSGVAPVSGLNGTNKLVNGPDLSFDSQSTNDRYIDRYGHGTHLASIIAGHDAGVVAAGGTNDTTSFLGIAPDARIVSVKVADGQGLSDVSQVIAGIDWVVQHAHSDGLNIRVLNLSFGTDSSQDYRLDPLTYAAEVAWRHGITVITAAGNRGSTDGHLADPAFDPYVIAVGSSDGQGTVNRRDDIVSAFSGRGDGVRNPDLVAPGAHVQGLRAPDSTIDQSSLDPSAFGQRFLRGSGTSQATAVVAGAAALLAQAHPSYPPDRVKALLLATTYPLSGQSTAAQGAGLLNMRNILSTYVAPTPQSFDPSTGTGTLEGSRGTMHLIAGDVTLQGEQDIFGHAFDAPAMAALEADQSSWTDGDWNGGSWTGSGWESSSWASSSWASSSWASSSWASSSWASSSWASSSWASSSWASSSWASSSWGG
ncbi:MAG: hypothetical protein QOJ60_684 [Actinomycetota bacterium]|nr:hypothetical protein [Actinomycetota bacterium]